MEHEGFIQYYQAIPNLRLFGQPLAYLCNFQAADVASKHSGIQALREADSIIDIADYLGESFGVTVSASSEQNAQETLDILSKRAGVPRFAHLPPREFPTPQRNLDRLDWQIVKSLRYDALKPTREIAKEAGATHRMVDYAIMRLLKSQVLFTRTIINAQDPKGIIFYSLNLTVEEKKQDTVTSDLRAAFGERIWWTFNLSAPTVILFLFSTSVGGAENDLLQAMSLSGVKSGSLTIFKGWVEPKRPNWIDKRIEERI